MRAMDDNNTVPSFGVNKTIVARIIVAAVIFAVLLPAAIRFLDPLFSRLTIDVEICESAQAGRPCDGHWRRAGSITYTSDADRQTVSASGPGSQYHVLEGCVVADRLNWRCDDFTPLKSIAAIDGQVAYVTVRNGRVYENAESSNKLRFISR